MPRSAWHDWRDALRAAYVTHLLTGRHQRVRRDPETLIWKVVCV